MTQVKLDPPAVCSSSGAVFVEPPSTTGLPDNSAEWFERNKANLLLLLPETWTHVCNINFVGLIYRLKLLGACISSDSDLANYLAQLERHKLLQRDGHLLRRAPY